MQHSILQRTALVFCGSLFINFASMFFVVLGSGVMPINFSLLLIATIPLSSAIAFVSYFVRRWPAFTLSALMVISFFATGRIFMHFLDNGLERAKIYASGVAFEVKALHQRTDTWPASLEELPMQKRPQINPDAMWPYRYYQEDNLYPSVGGFSIIYRLKNQVPELIVARRDISVCWNWEDSRWEDTP
jgi:hypothetical protein